MRLIGVVCHCFRPVNDAVETNTSISVIRLSSPTPSLQNELDEQDELERQLTRMYADDQADDDTPENKAIATGQMNGNRSKRKTDSDADEDDDDDDSDGGTSDDDADGDDDDDNSSNSESSDENDESGEDDKSKRRRDNKSNKVEGGRKKPHKVPVKVPQVSLTVEEFYSPAEARQLASTILGESGGICCYLNCPLNSIFPTFRQPLPVSSIRAR